MSIIKKSTTYSEQIELLRNRGCVINDEEFCKRVLENTKYYRLTAYFLPFKNDDNTYKEGTSFSQVYNIYEFDRKLRNILFAAIEKVEISLRSRLSYYHATVYGPLGYTDASNFNGKHKHDVFTLKYENEINNNEKVPFVSHHITKYNRKFPIWVITELFTFGMLSYFYNDLPTQDRKAIAEQYNIHYGDMASWLRCCTDLRNICAHYGRLYNRIFSAIPSGIELNEREQRRLWGALQALKGLYPYSDEWNCEVLPRLADLFAEYKDDISLFYIAFPSDWYSKLKK